MIELKSRGELAAMREAGRVVARALAATREYAAIGVRLDELDAVARSVISDAGAEPLFLGYRPSWAPSPFPGAICTSVNEVIVHGPPGPARLGDGDLLSIDCGASVDGWCADAAISVVVGRGGTIAGELVATTEQALWDGIDAAHPGVRIGDISHAIGIVGRSAGFGIPGRLGGHGVGRQWHESPFVPNDGAPGRGMPLRPGLVLAIEPMFVTGGRDAIDTGADGWSVLAADGECAAHVEHTVAITDDGPVVLTVD
ncbi:type I methionyl aminopeptidase [Allosaccharopolyspora coralli]|uniref:Methionine aminopeptidase n=1 Tax=Allosaccharopolyspora coralli TaxID=2665642 RepID=A0A5Q3Q6Q2_9PSEU|nr:type I methionyl aminopeptidase [Allosaccharopolyspora coralli]QGK70013.1 type I methionyl aminopeptidase [Allosaccharopolyspora coralli]